MENNIVLERVLPLNLRHMGSISIQEQKVIEGRIFPLVLAPTEHQSSLKESLVCIKEERYEILNLLLDHKAILLRNFALSSAQDFNDAIQEFKLKTMEYVGGAAVRTQLTPLVFTANESPSSEKIPFHHEMSQVPEPPTHLFFFCETAATLGGETPLLVSGDMYDRISAAHPAFMEQIEKLGVRYVRVMGEEDDPTSAIGRGWKSTYLTTDRATAEEKLKAQGCTWEWDYLAPGNLKTVTAALPAVRVDSGEGRSNRKTFFNSMVAAYLGWNDSRNSGETAVLLGDGSPIDAQAMAIAAQIMEDICVAFQWQPGDLLLVDNRSAMHARRPYEGKRRILASLARDHAH
eukprot:gene4303-8561_t